METTARYELCRIISVAFSVRMLLVDYKWGNIQYTILKPGTSVKFTFCAYRIPKSVVYFLLYLDNIFHSLCRTLHTAVTCHVVFA